MNERSSRIARAMLWDALILLALAVYELMTRLDAMWGPLKMFVNMAVGEHIPARRVLTQYVDWQIFVVPLFMLGCAILAVWALFARRSRRGCAWLLLPCAVMTALGFTLDVTLFGQLVQVVKLLPLVLLTVLCALRVFLRPKRVDKQPAPTPVPLQPEVITIRRRRSERRGRSERRRAS